MAEPRKGNKDGPDHRLAVDVGNTQTVIGLFDGDLIMKHWRLATRKDVTVDEIVLWLRGLVVPAVAGRATKSGGPPVRSVLASVVPAQDAPWRAALHEITGQVPRSLNHRDCGGLRLDYDVPSQIGADRLANVLGARALGIREGVVVDFGTATTFDVFSDGAYHGGVICPGLHTGMRSLAQNAARLSEADLRWPESVVGRTTEEAMRAGVLRGAVGMVEHLLREILAERRMPKPVVLATGGLAHWIKGRTAAIRRFEPDLTLIGINRLLSEPVPDMTKPAMSRAKRTATGKNPRKNPS
jgi:type III pantothenate kinase